MNVNQARAEFTKKLVAVYQERIKPTFFLRSFFPSTTAPTKYVSIEVERMGEKVAIDVLRGTDGNRNAFSRSTEKIFFPPYWREFFDATELELYDRVLGSQGDAQVPLFVALMNTVADRLGLLQDKIERAKELQCSQVLQTGVVTINEGTDIDFKRKAASIVDLTGAGGYFAANSDVFAQFKAAGDFLRTVGRSGDTMFNAIFGAQALTDFLANTKFTARQNLFNMALDAVLPMTRNANGSAYHGTITAGSYKIALWTYPQFYDKKNADGTYTATPYVDDKKVIVLPTVPKFVFAHAAVPQLIGEPGQLPSQGEYTIGEFIDQRKAVHDFDIQSAGLPIPVAVDMIYTMKTVS